MSSTITLGDYCLGYFSCLKSLKIYILENMAYVQGAPIENNPLRKIHYFHNDCSRFLTKFYIFTQEDSCHLCSNFYYNICLKLKLFKI